MREPKLSAKGRSLMRLTEKVGFTVLTASGALIAGFTEHPVIAFALAVWAVVEAKGAFKAFFRYTEVPSAVVASGDVPETKDMGNVKEEETMK